VTAPLARQPALWRIVAPAFFAQNLAFGISQGSFGPLLPANAAHFGVSQSTMILCASMLNLSLGLVAPLVSGFMDRIPIRRIMICGSLASAAGYYGLYASSIFPIALAMYFLLGVGCAILGVLAPLTLVNRWLPERRGRVLGWVNAPIVLLLVPLIVGQLIGTIGRDGLLLAAAAILLATIPLFMAAPQAADCIPMSPQKESGSPERRGEVRELLGSASFWTIAIAIGVLAGMSSAFIVNVVSIGTDRGMSFPAAASLVSVFAASGAAGSVALGWLCDRIGALPTVAISAFCQAVLCIALVFAEAGHTFPLVSMIGIFSAPILTLMGAAVSQTIAPHLVNRAIGAVYFVKLPFIFAFAPLFEYFSHFGARYSLSFYLMSVALGLTAGALLLLHRSRCRSHGSAPPQCGPAAS
jgi:MFS family permease